MTATRYPLADLARKLHIELGQIGGHGRAVEHDQRPQGLAALAEAVRWTGTREQLRWLDTRGLDELEADELAVAAGFLPADVWPDWADLDAEPDLDTLDLELDGEGYADDPAVEDLEPIDETRLHALREAYRAGERIRHETPVDDPAAA